MAEDHPIRLLCLDVDGVLTDGAITISDRGVETKRFNVRDGLAMRVWQALGNEIAVITGRQSMVVQHRMNELGVRFVFQGVQDKAETFGELLRTLDMPASASAMLGDDLPDMPVLRLAGYPMAVADAPPEVRALASYVTVTRGGQGAVREAVEHLLKDADRWDEALALFG
jgi:3-deoxy-D-manno-octulosonate 8-phosphate phosphatase (KDO 8-P phosphatase)